MNRLRHSYTGQLRLMQISSIDLYVFVEGTQSDPYFFAGICATVNPSNVRYEISSANQLPRGTGGKQKLLDFFSFLRLRKALVSSFQGQTTASIFILDKDLDDLQRKRKRSQHVVYTEYYDVQNYIFVYGNILNGAASAASVDPAILEAELNDAQRWCRRIAMRWRKWISLCIRMMEEKISCEANYSVLSRVQTRLSGDTNTRQYDTLVRNLAISCGLSEQDFRRRLSTTIRKVDKYFALGQHHRLFKGKWFSAILADDIDRIMSGRPYDKNRLSNRLPSTIAATLDFNEPWTDYFKNSIRSVIAML